MTLSLSPLDNGEDNTTSSTTSDAPLVSFSSLDITAKKTKNGKSQNQFDESKNSDRNNGNNGNNGNSKNVFGNSKSNSKDSVSGSVSVSGNGNILSSSLSSSVERAIEVLAGLVGRTHVKEEIVHGSYRYVRAFI